MFTVQKGRVLCLSDFHGRGIKGVSEGEDVTGGFQSKTNLNNTRWPFGDRESIAPQGNSINHTKRRDVASQMTETRHAIAQAWIDTQKTGALVQKYIGQIGRIGI